MIWSEESHQVNAQEKLNEDHRKLFRFLKRYIEHTMNEQEVVAGILDKHVQKRLQEGNCETACAVLCREALQGGLVRQPELSGSRPWH